MAYKEPEPTPEEIEPGQPLNADLSKVDRQGRQEATIYLKMAGATYTEIAETLGYASANHARLAFERALAANVGPEEREQQRFIANRRLERILRSMWSKSTDEESPEHLAYARTALAYIDRMIRLNGLDAPTEVTVYTPGSVEIEQWLKKATAKMVEAGPDEVDIIEGETIELDDDEDGKIA